MLLAVFLLTGGTFFSLEDCGLFCCKNPLFVLWVNTGDVPRREVWVTLSLLTEILADSDTILLLLGESGNVQAAVLSETWVLMFIGW